MKKHHVVTIYVNENQFSSLTKEFFRNNGVDFEEINTARDKKAGDQIKAKTGQEDMPITEFDGRTIIGYRPDVFETLLEADENFSHKTDTEATPEE